MEEILRSAFANLLKEVSDPHKIHAAIIEDYKEIYKTGIYASTMKDPKTKKKQANVRTHEKGLIPFSKLQLMVSINLLL